MPEGPEIRRAADRIAAAVVGTRPQRVYFAFEHLKGFEPQLAGVEVHAVEPRGKALLVHFANGLTIYSHNQLYGRWFIRRPGQRPATRRQLRLAIDGERASALLYSASEIDVLDEVGLSEHPFLAKLGPDVLAPGTQPRAIERRLASSAFANRQLGALLLDQGFLAGLGNYLRSEVLFATGVAPELRAVDLTPAERTRLARSIRKLARRAYRTGGITNDPERVRRLRADGEPRRRYRHYVFARAGEPCYACGATVRKRESASRRVYVCQRCQRRR